MLFFLLKYAFHDAIKNADNWRLILAAVIVSLKMLIKNVNIIVKIYIVPSFYISLFFSQARM